MITLNGFLYALRYIAAIAVFVCIVLTPLYLAFANDRSKYDNMRVRMGSLMFGWSIIGWFFALFISAKK